MSIAQHTGQAAMQPVDSYLDEVLAAIRPLPPRELRLDEAGGAVLAEDVTAAWALPPFDNSGMDGYAVLAADVAAATPERPVTLPVRGEVPAGDTRTHHLDQGTCLRIMTGAPVPSGADAIVPVEWTDGGIAHVTISRAAEPGYSIRRAGGDAVPGDVLLTAGTRVGPVQIGLLAAAGRDTVTARPSPRITVMSTGDELIEPGQPVRPGQIWESNSRMLAAAAQQAGYPARRHAIVPDDKAAVLAAIEEALADTDLLVTTGGVSMGGEHDIVKAALQDLGTVAFRKIAMQPGMPQGFGVVGPAGTPIFTLPGNPVSAYVSFQLFVRPAASALQVFRARTPRRHVGRASRAGPVAVRSQVVPPRGAGLGGRDRGAGVRAVVAPAGVAGQGRRADRRARVRDRAARWRDRRGADAAMTGRSGSGPALTHIDAAGQARMVDVSAKEVTARAATASGRVLLSPAAVAALRDGTVPKGDALAVARIAGIQGAKRTPDLIPLCHPIGLHSVAVELSVLDDGVEITATARTADRTGVEMEALTAVSVAALALIDMIKAVDPAAVISDVRVEEKTGGKTGTWRREP